MRASLLLFLFGMPILLVGCDPGMTIHQAQLQNDGRASINSVSGPVTVYVKTTRQLIGETWYAPEIKVANSLESPVAVTGVELTIQGKTYANNSPSPKKYPVEIPPASTETLPLLFRLDDNVREAFKQPAELSVHYRNGNKDEIATVNIVGGHLQD